MIYNRIYKKYDFSPEVLRFCVTLGVFGYILQKYLDLIYIYIYNWISGNCLQNHNVKGELENGNDRRKSSRII